MSGHTPLPETVTNAQHTLRTPKPVIPPPVTGTVENPHSIIMQLCNMSKRRTKRDNLPYLAKPKEGRNVLGTIFAQLGYTVGAEIGVKKGIFSKVLVGANPNLHLFCIDAWGMDNDGYEERHRRNYASAKALLSGCNVTFMQKLSMDAMADFKDESLDFVYIDANHSFDCACADLIFWSQKVRPGGIVSGHDYFRHYRGGVVEAVDAYTRCHKIDPWYVTLELWPSFFWVKP